MTLPFLLIFCIIPTLPSPESLPLYISLPASIFILQAIIMKRNLVTIFKSITGFLLICIMIIGIINVNDILSISHDPDCTYNVLTVEHNTQQKNISLQYQKKTPKLDNISYELLKDNKICYTSASQSKCISTTFKPQSQYNYVNTQDYLVLQNKAEFLTIHKASGERFIKSKQLHLRKDTTANYLAFQNNNLFLFESNKIYIVYSIENRNINTCLFLQKTSSNYTQHIMEYENDTLLLLSFPKRSQILLQLYNCGTNQLIKTQKYVLEEWMKEYDYAFVNKQLTIRFKTAFDNIYEYIIDSNVWQVKIYKQSKYESNKELKIKQCSSIIPLPTLFTFLKEEVQNYVMVLRKQLSKWYPNITLSVQFPFNYKANKPRKLSFENIKFFYENKIIKFDSKTEKSEIISLGKYLIRTNTPVFHNFEGANFSQLEQNSKETVYYLENDSIHSAEYVDVYQVYPKAEVQWVGFTKTFINFYPYNKQSQLYRYIRTKDGGLTFEGNIFKGKWDYKQKNEFQNYQELTDKPKEVVKNIWEAHAAWVCLFVDYHIVNDYVKTINIITGFNGRVAYSFTIGQKVLPKFVYTSIQNNEFFLSIYDAQKDSSTLTKVEFYVDALSKKNQLLPVKRQYTFKSRLLQIKKISNLYYMNTYSNKVLGLYSIEENILSNRRPYFSAEYESKTEKSIINPYYLPASRELELYGIELYQVESPLEKIDIIHKSKIYSVLKQQSNQKFYIVDIRTLIHNKSMAYRDRLRLLFSIVSICLFPIFIFLMRLKKSLRPIASTGPQETKKKKN